MERNNFQRLVEEQSFDLQKPLQTVENRLNGSINLFQHIGNVVDLYLPKVVDMFVTASGGDNKKRNKKGFAAPSGAPHWRNRPKRNTGNTGPIKNV